MFERENGVNEEAGYETEEFRELRSKRWNWAGVSDEVQETTEM